MRFERLGAVAVAASILWAGCASDDKKPATKGKAVQVKGRAMGRNVTDVVALPAAKAGKTARPVRAKVAADGSFSVPLPRGERYTLAFENQGRKAGALSFPSRPAGPPSFVLNLSVNVTLSAELFDFGVIGGSGTSFSPQYNPCELWFDIDGDGSFDYADDDDDGDGILDLSDDDEDGDGLDDADEDFDVDGDGLLDFLDDDDDGDGILDTADTDDDGDGILDVTDGDDNGDDADDDGISDAYDDDDDGDGIDDAEDTDDDGDGISDDTEDGADDADGDGVDDAQDDDDDNDGVDDAEDDDDDGDGIPDSEDSDSETP